MMKILDLVSILFSILSIREIKSERDPSKSLLLRDAELR